MTSRGYMPSIMGDDHTVACSLSSPHSHRDSLLATATLRASRWLS